MTLKPSVFLSSMTLGHGFNLKYSKYARLPKGRITQMTAKSTIILYFLSKLRIIIFYYYQTMRTHTYSCTSITRVIYTTMPYTFLDKAGKPTDLNKKSSCCFDSWRTSRCINKQRFSLFYSLHSKLAILEIRLSTLGLTAYWRLFSLGFTLVPWSGLILKMHLWKKFKILSMYSHNMEG